MNSKGGRAGRGEPVARTDVLAHRAAVHRLHDPVDDPARCAVLSTGVQDFPTGTTAHVALRPRLTGSVDDLVGAGSLALAYSARASLHLHPADDLPTVAAAVRPVDAADQSKDFGPWGADLLAQGMTVDEALEQIVGAMTSAARDEVTKGELSTAVGAAVDKRLLHWCEGCGAHHVSDSLFRYAVLQAGLVVARERSGPTRMRPGPAGGVAPDPADARREMLRRYLRVAGTATPKQVAAWLALTPRAIRTRWWDPLAEHLGDDLVEVDVEGSRAWMHAEDLAELRKAPKPPPLRLLPPYDPLLEVSDREMLVPAKEHRQQVWRPATSPGVVVADGEIAGVWRQRTTKKVLTLTVKPFRALTAGERTALDTEAEQVGTLLGAGDTRVTVEDAPA